MPLLEYGMCVQKLFPLDGNARQIQRYALLLEIVVWSCLVLVFGCKLSKICVIGWHLRTFESCELITNWARYVLLGGTWGHLNHANWLQIEQDMCYTSWRVPILRKTYQTLEHSMHSHMTPCKHTFHSSQTLVKKSHHLVYLLKISSLNWMCSQLEEIWCVKNSSSIHIHKNKVIKSISMDDLVNGTLRFSLFKGIAANCELEFLFGYSFWAFPSCS
jgi:hypothetical protein